MIGGLGIYTPEEVGPMSFQVPNGVVDILVEDEAEAVRVAKQYLSYFQGSADNWEAPDQRKLRHIVPKIGCVFYMQKYAPWPIRIQYWKSAPGSVLG